MVLGAAHTSRLLETRPLAGARFHLRRSAVKTHLMPLPFSAPRRFSFRRRRCRYLAALTR